MRFLNLDVDFESSEPLDPIIEHLGDSVVVMFNGVFEQSHKLSLELSGLTGLVIPPKNRWTNK